MPRLGRARTQGALLAAAALAYVVNLGAAGQRLARWRGEAGSDNATDGAKAEDGNDEEAAN